MSRLRNDHQYRDRNALAFCKGKHPLYEIQVRSELLEREIIETKIEDTEALLSHLLKMNMLVRGLIAVGLAELEPKATTEEVVLP